MCTIHQGVRDVYPCNDANHSAAFLVPSLQDFEGLLMISDAVLQPKNSKPTVVCHPVIQCVSGPTVPVCIIIRLHFPVCFYIGLGRLASSE